MMSGVKKKNDRLVSQILYCNNQISLKNSEKVLSFAPGEGNIPLGIFMDRDSVVKPDLIAKIGKYQFIIAQCVGGN